MFHSSILNFRSGFLDIKCVWSSYRAWNKVHSIFFIKKTISNVCDKLLRTFSYIFSLTIIWFKYGIKYVLTCCLMPKNIYLCNLYTHVITLVSAIVCDLICWMLSSFYCIVMMSDCEMCIRWYCWYLFKVGC